MNIVTPGVVLSRKQYGEYGRMAMIYTRDLGKVVARLAGVDRPKAKLKAFSEPMVCAEYRLYLRPGSSWVTVTGGRIIDCYPDLRLDLDRMLGGLEMCELLLRLTPEHSPNPKKYELITHFLAAFADNASPWLPLAFGLRLLELLGIGSDETQIHVEDREIFERLINDPIEALPSPLWGEEEGERGKHIHRLHEFLLRTAEVYLQRPLEVPRVRASLKIPIEVPA